MYDMNKTSKQIAVFIIGTVAFFFLLGIAGTLDYRAEVIYSMSQETYDEIVEKVGKSESKIVEEYMSNKAFYDSLP